MTSSATSAGLQRVQLGFSCNNACVFCAQGGLRDTEPPSDPTDTIVKAARGGGVVAFLGGEPTLFPELLEWVTLARASGATGVLVQTNGRRCSYLPYSRALAGAGATALEVSLQGSSAPMHDYHTTVEGSFAQTLSGIRAARQAGLSVSVTTVLTRSNYRHLGALVTLVNGLGVRRVHARPVSASGRASDAARLHVSPELGGPYLREALRVARTLDVVLSLADADGTFAGLGRVELRPPRAGPRLTVLP